MGFYTRMKLCLFSLLAFAFAELSGQINTDSLAIAQSKNRALSLYEKTMEGTHHLYNGSEYFDYESIGDEHPYFLTDDWSYSDLKYDGEWFRNVPLLLNIDKNQLIASYFYNGNMMQLVNSRVDEFILQNHHFINIKSTTDSTTLKPGYYELLYGGRTQVLIRYSKKLSEKLEGIELYRKFVESSQIYVVHDNQYTRIRGKRDLLKTLGSNKKELKEYIRNQSLFIKGKEKSIVQTVAYFDKINAK